MKEMIVNLGGRDIDLSKAVPLTLGDWRKLEASGIQPTSLGNGKITEMITFVHYVLNKADNTVTVAEVESMEINDKRIMTVVQAINRGEEEISRPS
jgi:hypothetical protein